MWVDTHKPRCRLVVITTIIIYLRAGGGWGCNAQEELGEGEYEAEDGGDHVEGAPVGVEEHLPVHVDAEPRDDRTQDADHPDLPRRVAQSHQKVVGPRRVPRRKL